MSGKKKAQQNATLLKQLVNHDKEQTAQNDSSNSDCEVDDNEEDAAATDSTTPNTDKRIVEDEESDEDVPVCEPPAQVSIFNGSAVLVRVADASLATNGRITA
jgi:hypothetical protein